MAKKKTTAPLHDGCEVLTRLQPGMVIRIGTELHDVIKVNDCDARVVPQAKREKTFTPVTGLNAGKAIKINSTANSFSISPNSECEIVSYPKKP